VRTDRGAGKKLRLGHEFTHAFDSLGSHYDGDGNERDWWDAATRAEYDKRAACLVESFEGMKLSADGQVRVSGTQTLAENIADLGGVTLALDSFLEQVGGLSRAKEIVFERELVGEKQQFSALQLFFIRWGQNMCMKFADETTMVATVGFSGKGVL